MTDANLERPSRPELPDSPDVSLSAALAYALYRAPGEVGHIDERSFYRALNKAAHNGEVRFWGREQKGEAYELAFGLRGAVVEEIGRSYFGTDEAPDKEASFRGFDAEYNRINAFCIWDEPGNIQEIIDSGQSNWVSYSNVRVDRDSFVSFVAGLTTESDESPTSEAPTPDVPDAAVSYPNMASAQSNKIRNAIVALWGSAARIPNDESKKEINHKIKAYIIDISEAGVSFSADPKTIRSTIDRMIEFERRDVHLACRPGSAG